MKNLENYKIESKRVLFRADLNVPVVDGIITDTSRIIAVKSSIKKLISKKNKIFLLAHFGRPNGEVVNRFSLSFILPSLKEIFNVDKIYFLKNLDEESIKTITEDMQGGDLCLVENIGPTSPKNIYMYIIIVVRLTIICIA